MLFVGLLISLPAFPEAPPKVLETTDVSGEKRFTLPIAAGSKLEVKGVFGEVEVLRAEGNEAVVEIARQSPGSEPRVVLLRHDQGYTLCVLHTSPNPKKPNECVPRRKGRMQQGIRKDWPRVHFTVRLPDGVDFMALLFGDRMAARAGARDLDLEMQSGEVFLHDKGSRHIQVETGGNIEATLSDKTWLPEVRVVKLDANGGNINVVIPESLPIGYTIDSWQPVKSAFEVETKDGMMRGTAGPEGERAMRIILHNALLGRITIRHP